MGNENTLYQAEAKDSTTELARLLESGLNERQIARMVRLRATYSHTSDDLDQSKFSKTEENGLAFMRWLRDTGRLES